MKKLLVLILVLGLCSTANAITVEIQVNGSDVGAGPYDVITTDTIQVYVYSGDVWDGALLLTNTSNSLVNGLATANAGDNPTCNPYMYSGYGDGYTIAADYLSTAPSAGIQFTMNVSGDIDDTGTVLLWTSEDWLTPADTLAYKIVPEPMTIALLGLGGLFLRRRR